MSDPKRIFLSHTSEFAKFPEGKSFIDAAIAGINRAGHVPCDMSYFTARDQQPADYCKKMVKECDVYLGVIGLRYGSPVRDRPEVSYTELEFEAACEKPSMSRLVFGLDPLASVPVALFSDDQFGSRQKAFGQRIKDAGLMTALFRDGHELEKLVYQALVENVPSQKATGSSQIDWPVGKSPYPGLEWFDSEYASLYCGRDQEVDAVIAKMGEPNNRFLIISGASGSGKSSLVGAGVWRAVVLEKRLPGSRNWKWCRIQPGDGEKTPFQGLAWGLKQSFTKITERPDLLTKQLAGNSQTLPAILKSNLDGDKELVLCLDQLEELFTRGFKNDDIRNFLDQLTATSQNTSNHLRVLTTVRSDFLPQLEGVESLLQLLNAGSSYHLGPISPLALADMITKPATVTGYEVESGLVEDILRDAAHEPGDLPLVAYTLKQLFARREGHRFTRAAYQAIGGVVGAIGTKAEQVVEKLGAKATQAFDRVFAELVHIERDGPPTRKRLRLSVMKDHKEAIELIQALAGPDCRVLITGRDEQGSTAEVAHEKLFTAWPRLREWIEQSKGDLRDIEHATEEACRWRERGELAEEVWPVGRTKEVLGALQRFGKTPSHDLARFLKPQEALCEQLHWDNLTHKQRAIIGWKLAQFGDPRPGVGPRKDGLPDIAWVEIPGGQVKLEDVDHMFEVKPFRLAKYPVTYIQFQGFIEDGGYQTAAWWEGISHRQHEPPKWNEPNVPRETVSWDEAVAFCRWLSARSKTSIRLPTEWEWQQAATGGDPAYAYPWGSVWDPTQCNSVESRVERTMSIGLYPHGATKQGVLDMEGNTWEWCLNKYDHPEKPESLRLDDSGEQRAVRGGYWYDRPEDLRSSSRNWSDTDDRGSNIGFRLAQDIE